MKTHYNLSGATYVVLRTKGFKSVTWVIPLRTRERGANETKNKLKIENKDSMEVNEIHKRNQSNQTRRWLN